jgi:hypothetical protein
MLRNLTARGATVVALGHQNKHKAPDGSPMFEGTDDLRNDMDEWIYRDGVKAPDGKGLLISTTPDKDRVLGIEPVTYRLHADRTVTLEG